MNLYTKILLSIMLWVPAWVVSVAEDSLSVQEVKVDTLASQGDVSTKSKREKRKQELSEKEHTRVIVGL